MRKCSLGKQHVALLVFMIGSALACSSTSPTKPIGSEGFPNTLGSWWIYAVYDSLTQERDTVGVRVVGETQVELWGESWPATRWRLEPALDDSIWYVITTGDTVRVWGDDEDGLPGLRFMYVFPLKVGNGWGPGGTCLDSTEVVAREEVAVPDGDEWTAYLLQLEGGDVNSYVNEERWFAPGVGLLSVHRWELYRKSSPPRAPRGCGTHYTSGARNDTWELISFEIASD